MRLVPVALMALVLSSCGERFQSPAAVVNGQGISQRELEEEVTLALSYPQIAQQASTAEGKKEVVRQVLAYLIRERLVLDYARSHDISVTPQQVEDALDQTVEQFGGESAFREEIGGRGLSLAEVRDVIRRNLTFDAVAQAIARERSGDRDPPPPQQVFNDWLRQRLRASDIDVNPRFGRLDLNRAEVVPITSTDS